MPAPISFVRDRSPRDLRRGVVSAVFLLLVVGVTGFGVLLAAGVVNPESAAEPATTRTPTPTDPATRTPGDPAKQEGRPPAKKSDWPPAIKVKDRFLARVTDLASKWRPPRTSRTVFRVASFNVLGASHTGKNGRHKRFTDAATRMGWTAQILGALEITVAGFQEFQPSQHGVFHRRAPGWSVWPTAAQGRRTMVNAVVWRRDVWRALQTHTVAIPYFGGNIRQMPYLLLEHRATGQRVWFTSFHNPADAHGPAQVWRNEATRRQILLARRLMSDGTPVVFTGDMNDREAYFCPMTASTRMRAANGGSTGPTCVPPAAPNVDWIFGSADLAFSNFAAIGTGLVARASDHPLIVVDARVKD